MPPAEVRLERHAARQFDRAPPSVQASLRKKARRLSKDPTEGIFLALARVPAGTRRAWERRIGTVPNLYKVDLPSGWRALYTVGSEGRLRVVLVLEVVDHRSYDRLLGYG